jgi:hypothetical protein
LIEFIDAEVGKVYNGGIQWHYPEWGIRIGATGFKSTDINTKVQLKIPRGPNAPLNIPTTDELDDFTTLVYSLEYTWTDLTLTAEYLDMLRKSTIAGFPRKIYVDPEGYYFSAAYRFNDWLETGAYYSVYYDDENDRGGEELAARGQPDYLAWQKDLAFTARFDILPDWLIKMEIHRINGVAILLPQTNPDGFEEDWHLFAVKTTFHF